ncbi:Hypothetical predicted protein [Octopus vulgaris]|uniref:Uncharacterized protein n=1 Tax=Octopus vulgaris TaxID=6645 RepID=A0AA36AYF4_OCTVU|nr:Hypothetical predicted protein [Octopus vulgaris]
MRFFYKTKQNISPKQCKSYRARNDCNASIESNYCEKKRDVSNCDTSNNSDISEYSESSFTSDTSDACTKDTDMRIIKKRKVYKHNPSGHLDLKGECQLESIMEVDLSSSIIGLNIESPQGQTSIEFERCSCKKLKFGGARLGDKKEVKANCLRPKAKAGKRKTRKSKRRKTKLQRDNNNVDDDDSYDDIVPIRGGVSNTIPYDIPYDEQ